MIWILRYVKMMKIDVWSIDKRIKEVNEIMIMRIENVVYGSSEFNWDINDVDMWEREMRIKCVLCQIKEK